MVLQHDPQKALSIGTYSDYCNEIATWAHQNYILSILELALLYQDQGQIKILTINKVYLKGYEIKVPEVPGENFL